MAQPASKVTEWHTSGIQAAVRIALEPWSSVSEKLRALEFVLQYPCAECVEVLGQAIFLFGLSRPLHAIIRVTGIPKGGEVAGAAARGLALRVEFGGVRVLEELLLNEGNSRVIRETAAYGLGASSHPEVFQVYGKALLTWDADVRFRVLLSLRESLDRIVEVEQDGIQWALLELSDLFVTRIRELQGGEHDVIVSILSRYIGPHCEERLGQVLTASRDPSALRGAFEVLRRRGNKNARARLMRVFASPDRPAQLYTLIADEVRTHTRIDNEIRNVAQSVLSEYPLSLRLLSFVSGRERARRVAQVQAAHSIVAQSTSS